MWNLALAILLRVNGCHSNHVRQRTGDFLKVISNWGRTRSMSSWSAAACSSESNWVLGGSQNCECCRESQWYFQRCKGTGCFFCIFVCLYRYLVWLNENTWKRLRYENQITELEWAACHPFRIGIDSSSIAFPLTDTSLFTLALYWGFLSGFFMNSAQVPWVASTSTPSTINKDFLLHSVREVLMLFSEICMLTSFSWYLPSFKRMFSFC